MGKFLVGCLLAIAIVVSPGCCPCGEDKDTIPVPGPIIIIKPDPKGMGELQVTVDGTAQSDGGAAAGLLRDDFIGVGVLKFECIDDSGVAYDATHIQATKSGYVLNLKRTSGGGIDWHLDVDDGSGSTHVVTLTSTESFEAGKVPSELLGYASDSLVDASTGTHCAEVRLQVDRAP